MTVNAILADRRSLVERGLDDLLPAEDAPPSTLSRAMRYAVFAGGKRIRPVLTLAAAEAVGADTTPLLPAACAIEMIHTYSLIHDDLPAMDDDHLRRGKPTTHVVFGEAQAILAGDALLTLAIEVLATRPGDDEMAALRSEVVARVARAIGAEGMVGGQMDDLEAVGGSGIDEDRLVSIHRRKTGALIETSVVVGAILARADASQRRLLERYGRAVGLAFQIVDDILDVESSADQLGKSAGKDARDDKLTYPAVLGIEESRRRARALEKEARTAAAAIGPRAALLGEIASFVISRKS